MNKYVSPIIEIELVEVESILNDFSKEVGENELPVIPVIPGLGGGTGNEGGGGGSSELPVIPNSMNQYFNA